jgi:hypothetical protein
VTSWHKAFTIGVGVLFLVAILAPLCALFPMIFWEAYEDYALVVAIGLFVLFYTLFVLGLVGLTALTVQRRARVLDAEFAPLGLTGSAYRISGRQYQGMISPGRDGERELRLTYHTSPLIYRAGFRRTRIERLHILAVALAASPGLVASFARHQTEKLAVDRLLYKKPQVDVATRVYEFPQLEVKDPDLMHLRVHPADQDSARMLLADPEAKAALVHLLGAFDEAWKVEQRFVYMQTDSVRLEIIAYVTSDIVAPLAFSAGNVQQWGAALNALAEVAEALSPSQMPNIAQRESFRLAHHKCSPLLEILRTNLTLVLFIASALFLWMCLGCGLLGVGLAVSLDGL